MEEIKDYTKQPLPNATAVLVLGIISLVISCSGIGLVLAIVGLNMSKQGWKLWKENPDNWDLYGSLNAGRIMCIIGLCINGLVVLYYIFAFIVFGAIFGTAASLGGLW